MSVGSSWTAVYYHLLCVTSASSAPLRFKNVSPQRRRERKGCAEKAELLESALVTWVISNF